MSIRRLRVARVTHLPSTPEKENRQAMKTSSPVPQSMRTLRNVTDACNDATEKSVVSCWRNPTFRFISDPTRAPEDTPRTGLRQAFSRPRPTRRWEAFRAPLEKRSPLDPIVREGTQQIRQAATSMGKSARYATVSSRPGKCARVPVDWMYGKPAPETNRQSWHRA